QLFDTVPIVVRRAKDPAPLCPKQPGNRGASEVNDKIPAAEDRSRPQMPPMSEQPLLLQGYYASDARCLGEQRRRGNAASQPDVRVTVALDQMVQKTRGQYGVADPGRGDEEDAHAWLGL